MRLEAMITSPAVESTCVTSAAYTNENSTRMKSNACRRLCPPSFVSTSNRPCEFQKRNQLFICAHNETRSIVMRVNDPYRSPVGIHGMSLTPSIIETRSPPGLTRSYPRRFTFYVARPARSIPKFTEPEKTFLCMDLSRRTRTQNR